MLSERQQGANIDMERVNRFESIWNTTSGSDFDKMLAMLHEYCAYTNWGTHAMDVWGKIKKYYGYSGSRQSVKIKKYNGFSGIHRPVKNKDAVAYTIQYLLFRCSEKFSFDDIKADGDLAAIFHVISTHTKIDPYIFNNKGHLYSVYKKHKEKIRKSAHDHSWDSIAGNLDDDAEFVGMLSKAKIIDDLTAWNVIVRPCDYLNVKPERLNNFNLHCPIDHKNLRIIFNSTLLDDCHFLYYLYCKHYELPLTVYYVDRNSYGFNMRGDFSKKCSRLIQSLCRVSDENSSDGVLLLDLVKRIVEERKVFTLGKYIPTDEINEIFLALAKKRHLIGTWDEIEDLLIKSYPCNYTDILNKAIRDGSQDVIHYLLNNKKMNINIKHHDQKSSLTPLMHALSFDDLVKRFDRKFGYQNLKEFVDIVKMLVSHDLDCINGKDGWGKDVFYYLDYILSMLRKIYGISEWGKDEVGDYVIADEYLEDEGNKEKVVKLLDELDGIRYMPRAFSFFRGFFDSKSTITNSGMPKEVVMIIASDAVNVKPTKKM